MSGAAPRRCRSARACTALALAATLAGAGCGGDDEGATSDQTSTSQTMPTHTVTVPARTTPEPERAQTAPRKPAEKPASPEDRPGGAGDEEPIRSEVLLTGRGGRIGPLLVKVPPFVSIRVALRSGDGKLYVLRFGRRVLKAGLRGARASATFDGLRPGRRLLGSAVSGKVVIEASAEPGP